MTRPPQAEQVAGLDIPDAGQLVLCRDRHWIVADVQPSQLGADDPTAGDRRQHLLTLASVEDDGLGETTSVIWELEPGAAALQTATLPEPRSGRFHPPEQQAAFLDAIRWGAITNADTAALQSPFRAGISIEDYQLDPVVRALEMPRVNLGIFDDVGLGKTIEAGLVVQELLQPAVMTAPETACPPRGAMTRRSGLHARTRTVGGGWRKVLRPELRSVVPWTGSMILRPARLAGCERITARSVR